MITELWYVKFEGSCLAFCLCFVFIFYNLWRITGVRESRRILKVCMQWMGTIGSKLMGFISAYVFTLMQYAIWIPFSSTLFVLQFVFSPYFLFGIQYECIITAFMRVRSLNNSIVADLCNSFPTVLLFCL